MKRSVKRDIQRIVKRILDIIGSMIGILLSSPIILLAAIMIKRTSSGVIIYKQERRGYKGQPFYIYKLRSMYTDAEPDGPLLASLDDPRITPFGKFMRKWRIDELPQFYNILIGDMSLVGPRPERAYYIDKIVAQHPEYLELLTCKPGLTSLGMVKFGYAENIYEMIERMQYDLEYIKNSSLWNDVKIIIQTFVVLTNGKGK